jgi:hypothetical protein
VSNVCRAGLFIGVDQYTHLPEAQWLRRAAADASALCSYFRQACPGGKWQLLIDDGTRRPTRVALIEALHSFARQTERDHAGLLYFAGHAVSRSEGLILAPCDFRPRLAQDTGLPLRRALEILKQKPHATKPFLVLLDCCRDGIQEALADDIPPNICVLYACSRGQATAEGRQGGVLTQAVLKSLAEFAHDGAGSAAWSVQALYRRLSQHVLSHYWSPAPVPELCGSRAERIDLPIAPGPLAGGLRQAPVCLLEGRSDSSTKLVDWYHHVGREYLSWLGHPPNGELSQHLLGQYLSFQEEPRLLTARLPADTVHWTSRQFLEHLLNRHTHAFERLVLVWPRDLDPLIFSPLKNLFPGGDWVRGPEGTFALTWRNKHRLGEYRGQVWVDLPSKERTLVRLTCQNGEARAFPLTYLLPSLGEMYDRLCSAEF